MKLRKRIRWILLLSATILAVALWRTEREPTYDGWTLSEWLLAYAYASPHGETADSEDAQEAIHAIRQIGTNALPYLLEWTTYRFPAWRARLTGAVDKVYRMKYDPVLPMLPHELPWTYRVAIGKGQSRLMLANYGFLALGSDASPAVPELTRRLRSGDPYAASALAAIGMEGLPGLMAVLVDPEAPERANAAYCVGRLSRFGTNVSPAVPLLANCITDNDPWVAHGAAASLGMLLLDPAISVPALVAGLQHSNRNVRYRCAASLQEFGPEAAQALPALRTALEDGDGVVRVSAKRAIEKIEMLDGETAEQSPRQN
jgi:hypothetical protein